MKVFKPLRNGATLLVVLPFLVVVTPFAALAVLVGRLSEKPATASEVATFLRSCLDGTVEDEAVDTFPHWKMADARLKEIRTEVRPFLGTDFNAPETRSKLRELLERAEAMERSAT